MEDDGEVIGGERFRRCALGGEVGFAIRVAVEVVVGEVEPDADAGAEGGDGFELEGTDFEGEHIVGLAGGEDLAERDAVVAARQRAQAGAIEDGGDEFGAGAFAVGAGDGDDGCGVVGEGELGLAGEGDASADEGCGRGQEASMPGLVMHQVKLARVDVRSRAAWSTT
jgi:hypothetical protein